MSYKMCLTPNCDEAFQTPYRQEKYCPACKKRRAGVLELYRNIRKEITVLRDGLLNYEIKSTYMNGELLLQIHVKGKSGNSIICKFVLSEHTPIEAHVVLRNVLKAYRYITKTRSKFADVIIKEDK